MNIPALATSIRNQRFDGAVLVAEALEGLSADISSVRNSLTAEVAEVAEAASSSAYLGNVYIQSVIATYEAPTDNANVLVKLTVTYKPPLPLYQFDRVKVYLEVTDGTGQIRLSEEFPYDAAGAATSVAIFYEPPTASENWRVYVVSGNVDGEFNPLRLFTQTSPSPSQQVTVVPLPEGGSGTEWTSNVTAFTAAVEYGVNQAGIQLYRIHGTFTDPADFTFRGVRVVADDGPEEWQLTYAPKGNESYFSKWYPVPEDSTPLTIYAQSQGPHYRLNAIVPGTTPSANVTIEHQAGLGGLKLTLVDTGTFNTDEFEIDPGEGFRVKVLNADKIQTGILRVGGGTSMPGQLGVFSGTGTLIGWIGEQDDGIGGNWYGGWFKQLYVGGNDPSDAPLTTNAAGELLITQAGGGTTVEINPTDGFKLTEAGGDYVALSSSGLFIQDSGGSAETTAFTRVAPQEVSVINSFSTGNPVGAIMQSSAGYGVIIATDSFGNSAVELDGAVGWISFKNVGPSGSPGRGALTAGADADAHWYDLDSTSWRRLAYADEISFDPSAFDASLIPASDIGYDLGSAAKRMRKVYTVSIDPDGSPLTIENETAIKGDFVPFGASLYDLGLVGAEWDNAYIDDIHITNDLNVGGLTRIDSSGTFFMRYYNQAGQPTPGAGETSMWIDSDDSNRTYLITNNGSSTLKVELT